MFEVGQQVICIDGSFSAKQRAWVQNFPVAGQRYRILEIEPGHRGLGLRLAELPNAAIPVIRTSTGEVFKFVPTFLSTRFKATTDISALRALLREGVSLAQHHERADGEQQPDEAGTGKT